MALVSDADFILRPDFAGRNALETPIHRLNLDKDRLDVARRHSERAELLHEGCIEASLDFQ